MRIAVGLLCVWFLSASCLADVNPARILLTFDDGPSTRKRNNPTEVILSVLQQNSVQSGIKAIFFTQTRLGPDKNGSLTKRLLQQEHEEGHVLAVHNGTLGALRSHRSMEGEELDTFLAESQAQLQQFSGRKPVLIRPPMWAFNNSILEAYQRQGLHMLLTDVSVGDGKSWGFRANPRRRSHLLKEMKAVEQRISAGEIPPVDGWIPIIVTFHDTNTWTASHMDEYLQILVDSAGKAGITLDAQPFYACADCLEAAALQRSIRETDPESLVPSPWNWLWY